LQFTHFLRKHFIHDFFDVDGRVARTMRSLLLRPGELAVNFIAGRRQGFTSPLRLYLVIYLLAVFIGVVFSLNTATLPELAKRTDPTGFVNRLIASRPDLDWSNEALRLHLAERAHWLREIGNFLVPAGVAIVLALLALIFRKLRRTYVEHLTLALTVQAWLVVMLIFGELLIVLLWRHSAHLAQLTIEPWIAILLPVYWALAIRRFYGVRLWQALITGLGVFVGQWFVATLVSVLLLSTLVVIA